MEEFLRIPQARIGALIGKNGAVKRKIEKDLGVRIEIDTEECSVKISDENTKDPLACWKGRDVVKAIARGFSPFKAFKLLEEDVILEIIDLKEYLGKSKNTLKRVKGRIIGKDGKTRKIIENMTGCYLSIYGKTIALIGEFEQVYDAKKAVEMLLHGSEHSSVYRFLEKVKRKKERHEIWR